ncbi:RNA polymerase subunit sigma, partial [Amycolatopsis sp. SID8362]|nr:RNA polymerase subunit sigma [Amycolatopsis sp. SID8362]NED41869.1 RNA polymerase subunit sigma [Amycolatopsis sp. SID8362]
MRTADEDPADAELLAALRAGDLAAGGALFRRHAG